MCVCSFFSPYSLINPHIPISISNYTFGHCVRENIVGAWAKDCTANEILLQYHPYHGSNIGNNYY